MSLAFDLPKLMALPPPACIWRMKEDPEDDEDQDGPDPSQDHHHVRRGLVLLLVLDEDLLRLELLAIGVRLLGALADERLALRLAVDRGLRAGRDESTLDPPVAGDLDLLDLPLIDLLPELGPGDRLLLRMARMNHLEGEDHHQAEDRPEEEVLTRLRAHASLRPRPPTPGNRPVPSRETPPARFARPRGGRRPGGVTGNGRMVPGGGGRHGLVPAYQIPPRPHKERCDLRRLPP